MAAYKSALTIMNFDSLQGYLEWRWKNILISLPVNYGNSSEFINLSASLEPIQLTEQV